MRFGLDWLIGTDDGARCNGNEPAETDSFERRESDNRKHA
jgi:hypothetical protein